MRPGTPPPRSPPGHVLRHGNADCSSAGLLPARASTTNTTAKPPQIEKHQLRPPPRASRHVDRARSRQKAQKHSTPASSSHTAAALTKRGWRQTKNPEEAELLWYQRKQLIDWGHVQSKQLVNHVKRERDIGHKRNLASMLAGTAAARWVPKHYDLSDKAQAAPRDQSPWRKSHRVPSWLVKGRGRTGERDRNLAEREGC